MIVGIHYTFLNVKLEHLLNSCDWPIHPAVYVLHADLFVILIYSNSLLLLCKNVFLIQNIIFCPIRH